MDRVQLALSNATQTHALEIGSGVLDKVPQVFKSQFPGKKAVVVAHAATWAVAGERVDTLLRQAGVETDASIVFKDADMHAEWKYIEQLDAKLSHTGAVAVAVGSGTINDITKLCSAHQGRPYMVVATAASMDGYVAFGASITRDGIKSTYKCAAPQAVVADVDVLATAPAGMTASGYADLMAKVPAGADWIVADVLGVEPIDPTPWNIVQGGLHDALSHPEACREGDPKALQALAEGLMLGGFAMQAYPASSRPASGAEHQISHMLNMDRFVTPDGQAPSHGFQVSIGTIVSLFFYEQLLHTDLSTLDIDALVMRWPSLEEQKEASLRMFRKSDFPTFAAGEIEAKYSSPEELRRHFEIMRDRQDELKSRLRQQLLTVPQAIGRLKAVGAPVHPRDIGLGREQMRATIIRSQQIRRRYTIFDVAVRMGTMEEWADRLMSSHFA